MISSDGSILRTPALIWIELSEYQAVFMKILAKSYVGILPLPLLPTQNVLRCALLRQWTIFFSCGGPLSLIELYSIDIDFVKR